MNLLLIFLLAQTHVTKSCKMENHPYILAHKDGTSEERDDWSVTCKTTAGDKTIDEKKLPLAHPTEFADAAAAARAFVKENK